MTDQLTPMTDQLTAIREYHSLMPEGALCECGQMEDACDVRFVLHLLDEAAAAERERCKAVAEEWWAKDKALDPLAVWDLEMVTEVILADPEAPTDD